LQFAYLGEISKKKYMDLLYMIAFVGGNGVIIQII
jgi:hypothetical protein